MLWGYPAAFFSGDCPVDIRFVPTEEESRAHGCIWKQETVSKIKMN